MRGRYPNCALPPPRTPEREGGATAGGNTFPCKRSAPPRAAAQSNSSVSAMPMTPTLKSISSAARRIHCYTFGAKMKTSTFRSLLLLTLSTLLVGLSVSECGKAAAQEVDPHDAVAAAPAFHRIVLENDSVRVLEIILKPGEKEPFHTHSLPGVMHIITGAKLRYTEATLSNGKILEGAVRELGHDGPPPPPFWIPAEGLHSAENIGSVTFHAFLTEIKTTPSRTMR
jgi:hypothetical protein